MTAKIIPNYPNYTIDEKGEVRSIRTGGVMKQGLSLNCYKFVEIYNGGGIKKKFTVHRLLYQCFVLKDGEVMPKFIDHKDCNRINNSISNLRPATREENQHNRLVNKNSKSGHKNIHLTNEGTFKVHIRINTSTVYRKTHKTLELAIADRDRVILEHFGAFANNGVITQTD